MNRPRTYSKRDTRNSAISDSFSTWADEPQVQHAPALPLSPQNIAVCTPLSTLATRQRPAVVGIQRGVYSGDAIVHRVPGQGTAVTLRPVRGESLHHVGTF